MTGPIAIGLSSWIIQDGNYGDFAAGEERAFALEFYASKPLVRVEPGDNSVPNYVHTGNAEYSVTGRCVHIEADWWVLDFGMLAYTHYPPPTTCASGDLVQGSIHLGIDPFFYFEDLSRRPGAPPLIFDWTVRRIEIQTASLIQATGRVYERDPTRLGWREITETNAWKDDGGHAEYILHGIVRSGPRNRLQP
jgi:hypothetical protein